MVNIHRNICLHLAEEYYHMLNIREVLEGGGNPESFFAKSLHVKGSGTHVIVYMIE